MALKKTQLLDVVSITGISTVGIYTVGVTATAGGVGVASTTYLRSVVMHNTGGGKAQVSLYINNDTSPVPAAGVAAARIMRVDMSSNETVFFETNYPIVMTSNDSLTVEINAPASDGSGIGSVVNFIVNGDTDIV